MADGVKVATRLLASYTTLPATAVPAGQASVKLLEVMVLGFMALLKVAVTWVLWPHR